jgi:hypothetical protein
VDVCDTPLHEKSWWWRDVPVVLVQCSDVRPEDGGGYGRVFEFVVAAHFGELIPVLPAGN